MSEAPEILTVDETAELLRCHNSTIYRKLERGEWPFAWKLGKDWRIEKDELMEHLRNKPVHTRQKAEDPMPRGRSDRSARFRATMDKGREIP